MDMLHKSNIWYQTTAYHNQKFCFATEIEYMGLLAEEDREKNLVLKSDNQGNVLALAVNSVHKIYC